MGEWYEYLGYRWRLDECAILREDCPLPDPLVPAVSSDSVVRAWLTDASRLVNSGHWHPRFAPVLRAGRVLGSCVYDSSGGLLAVVAPYRFLGQWRPEWGPVVGRHGEVLYGG